MILDYQNDPDAHLYEILDLATWQPLPMDDVYSNITYADDQQGILRIALRDEKGYYRLDSNNNVAWREMKRLIRIVKK